MVRLAMADHKWLIKFSPWSLTENEFLLVHISYESVFHYNHREPLERMLIIFFTHLGEIASKFTKITGGKIYASAILAGIMEKQSMFSQDPGFGRRSQ